MSTKLIIRQKEILSVARALLAESGYQGMTTRELARRAGVKEPILYRCFSGKEALVATILKEVRQEQLDEWLEIAKNHDPATAVEILVSNYLARPSEASPALRIFMRLSSETLPPMVQASLRETYEEYRTFLARLLKECKTENPEEKAWALLFWGAGIGVLQLTGLQTASCPKTIKSQLDLALQLIARSS